MAIRNCLVTGAGSGIGAAVAELLSGQGHRVALAGRREEPLRELSARLPGPGLVLPTDVTRPEDIESMFAACEESWGPVEVLVHSAGAGDSARLESTTDTMWDRQLELNLTAPFRCVRRAVPAMRKAGFGRIVVVASVASKVGAPYVSAYTAAKHGVLGLVRSAAAELADTGVTVNAVCPGYVDTPMTDRSVASIAAHTGRDADGIRAKLAAAQPIGRLILPGEVAAVIGLLVQEEALNGQSLMVDGGSVQS
ncbi:SDR family oxidoreductase [Streptomyces lavenduligriseus]|nr:SDR family oxidoreductase [Streptomyces lavenduligriseus]